MKRVMKNFNSGQGLDRGYTVEGLIVSYLTRNQSEQMDRFLQRARFWIS